MKNDAALQDWKRDFERSSFRHRFQESVAVSSAMSDFNGKTMPHLIFEYTDNLGDEADITGLTRKAAGVLQSQDGVFPIGGVRVRAIELEHYCIADGQRAEDAFVHAHLKIGAGRTDAQKKKTCDELFAMMTEHFAPQYEKRGLALSLELSEFSEAGTWKQNNLHALCTKS